MDNLQRSLIKQALIELDYPIMSEDALKCDEKLAKIYANFIRYVSERKGRVDIICQLNLFEICEKDNAA